MSAPLATRLFLSGHVSCNDGYILVGRILILKLKCFRNANILLASQPCHFFSLWASTGPPTDPNNIASDYLQISKVC